MIPESSCNQWRGAQSLWRKWAHEVGFAVNQKKKKTKSGEEDQEVCGNTGKHLTQHLHGMQFKTHPRNKNIYTNVQLCRTQEVVANT